MGSRGNAEYMGTHPIFESDFDCLTDFEIWATKTFGSHTKARTPLARVSAIAAFKVGESTSSSILAHLDNLAVDYAVLYALMFKFTLDSTNNPCSCIFYFYLFLIKVS